MLIAIMGDTFNNAIVDRDINSSTEQIKIMHDASPMINKDEIAKKEGLKKEKVIQDLSGL